MGRDEPIPVPRPSNEPQEGMTEATGNLTPDDADDAFVPAETRELTDPGAGRDVTAAAHRRSEERRASGSDDPGSLIARRENMPPNDRDGGYGSEHGLSGDDPAYAEEAHLPEGPNRGAHPRRDTDVGGDQERDPIDDRF